MITRAVWEDKLPDDKVKYYNKTRMSLELFCRTVGVAQIVMEKELAQNGYYYNAAERIFEFRPGRLNVPTYRSHDVKDNPLLASRFVPK